MKQRLQSILWSGVVAMVCAPASIAQVDGPPGLIDYQGRVLDGLGNPVADGAIENIEMYFRIWNHLSDTAGGNLLWAEKQVVTVADGNFSVRLGEGSPIESSAGDNVVVSGVDDPRPSLLAVFDGAERFLGLSVAPNSTTKPQAEIQPRLAFLTAPYAAVAEKARFAEFGPTNGTFEVDLIGVGTSSPGAPLEVAGGGFIGASDGSGLVSVGATDAAHIALDADDIQKFNNATTPGTLFLNDYGGNVDIGSNGATTSIQGTKRFTGGDLTVLGGNLGIGTTSPGDLLQLGQFNTGNTYVKVTTAGGNQFRSGIKLLHFNDNVGWVIESDERGSGPLGLHFRQGGVSGPTRMFVRPGGNLGIGTTSPEGDLHVVRPDTDIARVYATGSSQGGGQFYAGQSTAYGGGFLYEGDNNPNVVGDADRIVFYRRDNGSEAEVFSYSYNSSNVTFSGDLYGAGNSLGIRGSDNTGTTAALVVNGAMLIDANEIDSTQGLLYMQSNVSDKRVAIADGPNYNNVTVSIKPGAGDPWALWIEGGNAAKPGGGSWASSSDRRLKKGIKDVRGSLDKLLRLRSVDFEYKEPEKLGYEDREYSGFIAQEAEEVFPEWVSEGPNGFKVIAVTGFEAHAVQAMRELREEKDAQLKERDEKIESLEARLARLEAMVGELTKTAN